MIVKLKKPYTRRDELKLFEVKASRTIPGQQREYRIVEQKRNKLREKKDNVKAKWLPAKMFVEVPECDFCSKPKKEKE